MHFTGSLIGNRLCQCNLRHSERQLAPSHKIAWKVAGAITEIQHRRGLEVIILRPGLIVFPEMRHPALRSGAQPDDPDLWWYVEPGDVAAAFRLALEADSIRNDAFLIGAADTRSSEPTLRLVQRRYGRLPEIRKPELYAAQPNAAVFDISHARDVLGYRPTSDWRRWDPETPSATAPAPIEQRSK